MPKNLSKFWTTSCAILNHIKDIENAHLNSIYLRYNPNIGKCAINQAKDIELINEYFKKYYDNVCV